MLSLLIVLALAPAPNWVELDRPSFEALRHSPAEVTVPAWAATRVVSVTPVADGVLLRARWTLRSLSQRAWFSGQVLGDMPGLRVESVLWDGQAAATAVGSEGVTVTGQVSGRATIEVVAFVPGDPVRAALRLLLLPAVRGELEASAPAGLVPLLQAPGEATPLERQAPRAVAAPLRKRGVARGGAGATGAGAGADAAGAAAAPVGPAGEVPLRFVTAAGQLDLSFGAAPAAPGDAAAVVVARAGLGLTVGDAELRGRGRLVWELRRGAVSTVQFAAPGLPADAEVTGPGVRAVQRSGETVRVELQAPVSTRLELELRWSAAIGKATESRVALPQIRFDEVFRAESSLQLARDGEVEAVPAATGWTPSSAAALPVWGQGLVEGTPTAAFIASGGGVGGELELLRFVPIEGPPVVVDVAAYTIATSREGRALMRAHYEVRNERAASLKIRPPQGFSVLGVRVAGETAVIARDRDGAWRVPLQRSVDTVSGLLSFPVEVALLGDAAAGAWARREKRELPLPRLDAPVAVTRVTLHLPPGYRSRLKPGEGEVVAAFTRGEGIHYGLGVGEVGAAEADALFQSAVKGWLGNDFDKAQSDLDRLRAMGANNENIERLQGNLDLIAGKDKDTDGKANANKQDESVNRRIREQARARAVDDQVAVQALQQEAEKSRQSGDYKAAESQYRKALEVGDKLAKLEQRESVEQSSVNAALLSELEVTKKEAKAVRQVQVASKSRRKFGFKGKAGGASKSRSSSFGAEDDERPVSYNKTPPRDAEERNGASDDDGDGYPSDEPTHEWRNAPATPADRGEGNLSAGQGVKEGGEVATPEPIEVPPPEEQAAVTTPAAMDVPVGGTNRSFTAVLDVTPTATKDAVGVRLAGTTGAESRYQVDGANATQLTPPAPAPIVAETISLPGVSRGGLFGRARQARASRRSKRAADSEKPMDPAKPAGAAGPAEKKPEPQGLPAPVVTASALSVVVPAIGEAVLYQRLLLPADAAHAVEVSAREPLISRD